MQLAIGIHANNTLLTDKAIVIIESLPFMADIYIRKQEGLAVHSKCPTNKARQLPVTGMSATENLGTISVNSLKCKHQALMIQLDIR